MSAELSLYGCDLSADVPHFSGGLWPINERWSGGYCAHSAAPEKKGGRREGEKERGVGIEAEIMRPHILAPQSMTSVWMLNILKSPFRQCFMMSLTWPWLWSRIAVSSFFVSSLGYRVQYSMWVFFINTYKQELSSTALHAVENTERSYIRFDGLHVYVTENVTKKIYQIFKKYRQVF